MIGEFKKRIKSKLGKGLVMVGEPNEVGWYEEEEGYKDPDDFFVMDEMVVYSKKDIEKAYAETLREMWNEFPSLLCCPIIVDTSPQVLHFSYKKSLELVKWKLKWSGKE